MNQDINIFLSTAEAVEFRAFQQYYAVFDLLVQKGIFNIRNGSCTIHFDSLGHIAKIERKDSLFDSRVKPLA